MDDPFPTDSTSDEASRLSALADLNVSGAANDPDLSDLPRLAVALTGTAGAALVFVGETEVDAAAQTGVSIPPLDRAGLDCRETLMHPGLTTVSPVRDSGFRSSCPLLRALPDVEFYASAPLKTSSGAVLGALVVLDAEPRSLTDTQASGLEALARQAMRLLELRSHRVVREGATVRRLAGIVPVGIVLVDASGRYTLTNAAAQAILRAPLEGSVYEAQAAFTLLQMDGAPLPLEECPLRLALQGHEPLSLRHLRIRFRDGEEKKVWFTSAALRDERNELRGALGIFQDVASELEPEARRLHEKDRLATAGRMAARVAHEINNPLAGIKNAFLLLKEGIPADYKYAHYVPRVQKEIDRIAAIVKHMFELYQPEEELGRRFPVEHTLHEILSFVEPAARARRVHLRLKTDGCGHAELPEGSFRQIMYNLLQNAVDASPEGGTVTVQVRVVDGMLECRVSDQGCGISPEILPFVFEPFFSTKVDRPGAGLGLGLPVSKALAEGLGGSLEFASEADSGTVFTVVLPVERPE